MRRLPLLVSFCCSIACSSGDKPAPPPSAVAPRTGAPSSDAANPDPGSQSGIVITLDVPALRRSTLASYEPELARLRLTKQMLRDRFESLTHLHVADVTGTARIGNRADLRVVLTLGSLVEATNVATLVQSQRQSPQLKQLFDRFDCVALGATVTFTLGMTEAQLAAVLPQLRALLPAN